MDNRDARNWGQKLNVDIFRENSLGCGGGNVCMEAFGQRDEFDPGWMNAGGMFTHASQTGSGVVDHPRHISMVYSCFESGFETKPLLRRIDGAIRVYHALFYLSIHAFLCRDCSMHCSSRMLNACSKECTSLSRVDTTVLATQLEKLSNEGVLVVHDVELHILVRGTCYLLLLSELDKSRYNARERWEHSTGIMYIKCS